MVGKSDRQKERKAIQRYKQKQNVWPNRGIRKFQNTYKTRQQTQWEGKIKKKQKYIRRYLWNGNRETKGRNKNITTKY